MFAIVSRTISWISIYASVVTSPSTTTSPVVVAVSQATRERGSWARNASRIASETWSQSLSGWPSVTDSEVKKSCGDCINEVGISGSLLPGRKIARLLIGKLVDRNAHGFELERGDLAIHFLGEGMDAVGKLALVLQQEF